MPRTSSGDTTSTEPDWRLLGVTTLVSAALPLAGSSPRKALYWYIWPLFALGVAYVIQFRDEFPLRWKVAAIPMTATSVVALALDWPFSGHVMWNVVFIGHAEMTGKRRSTWMGLLVGSLVYLFVLKGFSQTRRDLLGGFISLGVGMAILALVGRPQPRSSTQ